MPNTGMLDHRAFSAYKSPKNRVHWMNSWPTRTGYNTLRFSRHLYGQMKQVQNECNKRPLTARVTPSKTDNMLAPFHTLLKPTCGYHYSEMTDHRKMKIGLKPSNVVAWRPINKRPHTAI